MGGLTITPRIVNKALRGDPGSPPRDDQREEASQRGAQPPNKCNIGSMVGRPIE